MRYQLLIAGAYIGIPAASAAVAGAVLKGWRGAAGLALVSILFFVLSPGLIPPIGILYPVVAGAGVAALVLTPVLFLRPATPRWLRALLGAAAVAGAGAYIIISNPGIA